MKPVREAPLTGRPRVSVVIPCYNYGRFLPSAVASAFDQAEVEVDVLIVDDASQDDSAGIALDLAAADERVEVLVHETNKGHIQTYNDGLSKVSGDYIVLLSADDLLAPNALTRAAALMERHPSVGFVYGYARSFAGAPPATSSAVRSWSIWAGHQWLRYSAHAGRSFVSSPEVVMRREALLQTEGYDPRLPHSGDFDMWLRTAARWDVGRVNGPTQAYYRVHAANMHLTAYSGWLLDLEERRRTFEILFEERSPAVPAVTRLRPVAMRALAREALQRALAAHRDEPGSPVIDSYLEFAARTYEPIRDTALWRLCHFGPVSGRQLPAAGLRRFSSRVRHHVVWRRERRIGR